MNWRDHISIDPQVMVGKPVIKGTRITVQLILELRGEGATEDDILASYPHLNREQIQAAYAYAAAALSSDELILVDQPAA